MKILLTGSRGQVGWELRRSLQPLGEIHAPTSAILDLRDGRALRDAVRAFKPDIIVNPAAYTAVDKAESEVEAAMAINGVAPGILAEEAARLDIPLVHFSTDYVFDGSGDKPFAEDDPTGPLNIYGRSKLAGERAIRSVGGRHLILRTSWVYGARGANFFLTMNRLLRERVELKVVADQIGAPTPSRLIASSCALIIPRLSGDLREVNGAFHLTAAGACSWHEFAGAIADGLRERDPSRPVAAVLPIPSADYPVPARRPANSRLDGARLREVFGLVMPEWRDALRLVQEEMTG